MGHLDDVLANYEAFVSLPWPKNLAGAQKIWFLVYSKTDERKIRARLDDLKAYTLANKHGWSEVDITDVFPTWMAGQEYREEYFREPELLETLAGDLARHVIEVVGGTLYQAGEEDVVCLLGASTLFGFVRISELLPELAPLVRGRLLVLFPGIHTPNGYRLLDARDDWNYLAVPITAATGANT